MAEITVKQPKKGRSRKALKVLSANEINIAVSEVAEKENRDGFSLSSKQKASAKNKAFSEKSLAGDLKEIQDKLEQLRIEKKKTEEILKERDELLKLKEEELEVRGKEQERLKKEIKKLQKIKEFKPTMSLPLVKSLREKEEEKKQKKKKKKDGPEQKKPRPAYVLWSKDHWNEIKKENPDAKFKEIANMLGAKWKTLSAEEKKPYEEKYQQEKEAYLQIVGQEKRENEALKLLEEEQMQMTAMELLEQYLQFKQEAETAGSKLKKEKDPLKPKKSMSAFFLYSKERRAALLEESKNVVEISKIAGEEWKNMTQEMKAPYEQAAKQQKEEYDREMGLYKQKKMEEAASLEKEEQEQKKVLKQEALQLLKKKEKTDNIIKKTKESKQKNKKQKQKNSDPNKPKKPASAFLLFTKETRKTFKAEKPGINNNTVNALLSVRWKELSESEKQIWIAKAAEGMETYRKEMEEYKKSIAAANNANICAI